MWNQDWSQIWSQGSRTVKVLDLWDRPGTRPNPSNLFWSTQIFFCHPVLIPSVTLGVSTVFSKNFYQAEYLLSKHSLMTVQTITHLWQSLVTGKNRRNKICLPCNNERVNDQVFSIAMTYNPHHTNLHNVFMSRLSVFHSPVQSADFAISGQTIVSKGRGWRCQVGYLVSDGGFF
jgi:hypothetical protein